MYSSLVQFDTPLENKKPGSLSVVILLSNTLFGKETVYLTEDQLANCTFHSQNYAYNKQGTEQSCTFTLSIPNYDSFFHSNQGYAIQGSAPIVKKKNECVQEEIDEVVKIGKVGRHLVSLPFFVLY
jgi:hypothetical protein